MARFLLAWVCSGLMTFPGIAGAFTNDFTGPALLTGTVYESGSTNQKVLFKFRRTAKAESNQLYVVREFFQPDGKLAAREKSRFDETNLMSFELEEFQIKIRSTARLERKPEFGSKIFFENGDIDASPSAVKKTETSLRPNTMVNDMLQPFVQLHWDELLAGKEVKLRYLVPDHSEAFGFKLTKESEATLLGKPVLVFRMAPTSRVIGAFVKPLFFTVEREGGRRILQYEGRTTPRAKRWGFWQCLDAVTVFDWDK